MGVEVTPLGFRKPDGDELVEDGENEIAHNAELTEKYLAEMIAAGRNHIDGGSPYAVYATEQNIDGGGI